MSQPISVCMIARNEEKRIERCLSSLKPYGFEIVVVDTGSNDSTKEIAKKYDDINKDNVDGILKHEIGEVFVKVLEDAGVYKCTADGRAAFMRFIKSI